MRRLLRPFARGAGGGSSAVRGVVALEAELGTTGGLGVVFPPVAPPPPSPRTPSPQGGTQQPADDTSESNIHCLTKRLSPTLYYRHASLRNTTLSTLRCLRCLRCLREFTPLCQHVEVRRPATNVLPLLHLLRARYTDCVLAHQPTESVSRQPPCLGNSPRVCGRRGSGYLPLVNTLHRTEGDPPGSPGQHLQPFLLHVHHRPRAAEAVEHAQQHN